MLARTLGKAGIPLAVVAAVAACGGPSGFGPSGRAVASLRVESGSGQTGIVGLTLPEPMVVVARDLAGVPLEGAEVTFEVTLGGGSVSPESATTDEDGRAAAVWTLGPGLGRNEVRARVGELVAEVATTASEAVPGERYEGRRGYIEYVAGELPIIITAPHGGTLEPDEIPDRSSGPTVRDVNTTELAYEMADSLEARTGRRPHLIVCLLRRTKLDANRDLAEAAEGDPNAERALRDFHDFIEYAHDRVAEEHGAGFYIDVHGHGHEIQRLELGYLLDEEDLALSDAELSDPAYAEASSIRTLAQTAAADFVELLRGETSLGTLYEGLGFPAVPSAQRPDPGGAPYFSGGYDTRRYGSRDGGPISGVQIEANRDGVRDSPDEWARFADASADILIAYFREHYGMELTPAARTAVAVRAATAAAPPTAAVRVPARTGPAVR